MLTLMGLVPQAVAIILTMMCLDAFSSSSVSSCSCFPPVWKNHQKVWLAGQSVDQHLLTSYHHAILSVVLAQFSFKGFADGMEGVVRLAEASPTIKVHVDMPPDLNIFPPFNSLNGVWSQVQLITQISC